MLLAACKLNITTYEELGLGDEKVKLQREEGLLLRVVRLTERGC